MKTKGQKNHLLAIVFFLQEQASLVNLAITLENEGITAFRFDFAGNG